MKRYKRIMILLLVMSLFLIIPASFASDNLTVTESSEIEADEPAEVPVLEATEDSEVVEGYMNVVYVNAENGTDNGAGTENDPVKTISKGYDLTESTGTIYLTGTFKGNGNTNLEISHVKANNVKFIGLGEATIDCENGEYFAKLTPYFDSEHMYYCVASFENILFITDYKNANEEYNRLFDENPFCTINLNNCLVKYHMDFSANRTEITAGETAAINIKTPTNSQGTCLIEYNEANYTGNFKNGLATIEIPNLKAGDYEFTVQFLGDDQFTPKNTTAVVKVNRKKLDVVYVNSENGTDNGAGTEDDPVRTIWQGFNLANDNGIIYLTGTFKGEGNSGLYFTQTPNNVTFIGLGEAVIDGEKSGRIFEIGEETNVTVKNIKFINGYAMDGGAIMVDGSCSLVNCSFINNTANFDGGAIYTSDFECSALNCSFINNTAIDNNGGAIANINSYFLAENCIFIGNHAGDSSDGGALFGCDALNCTFINNIADKAGAMNGGGAVNCTFINNTARNGNGGAFSGNTAINCTFINNIAHGKGGAIDNGDDGAQVINCIFINNTADSGSVYHSYMWVSQVSINNNIILNNNGVEFDVRRPEVYNFDYNWFGNNVTNYNETPEVGIDLNNWLFLNATAKPASVSLAQSSEIIFKLSLYNATLNNESYYDDDCLMPVELTINSTLGAVDKNHTNFGEKIVYSPDSLGNGRVTASFENVFCTIEIENQKVEPDMSIESYPSYAGDNATVTVTLPQDATGNVTVTDADGNNYTRPVKDGTADIEVPNLNVGLNKLNITYSGDDEKYLSKTIEYTVQVNPMPTFLTAEVLEKYQGDDDRFAVVLTDANGNPVAGMPVKIHIVGKVYNCTTNESGVATLPINLKPGIYNVTVEFAGKGDYANATPISSEVHVLTKIRIDKNKDLVKDYGDADKFTVRLVDEYGKPVAGEVVNMTVAGKTYHCKSNADGYASLAINLKPGTYDIVCEYAGYKTTNKITVKQVLSAYNRQYKKASSYQFTATLKHTNGKPISGKTVTFTFKGKTYTQNTNSKGEATITIKEALNIGKYNIAIKYLDSTITKTITIK